MLMIMHQILSNICYRHNFHRIIYFSTFINMRTKQETVMMDNDYFCSTPMPLMESSCNSVFEKSELSSNFTQIDEHNETAQQLRKSNPKVNLLMKGLGEIQTTKGSQIAVLNKKEMVSTEIPAGLIISTVLRKKDKGWKAFLTPEYILTLKANNRDIVFVKNYPLSSSQIFRLSTEENNFSHQSPSFLGSISANLGEKQFWLRSPIPDNIILETSVKKLEYLKIFIDYSQKGKMSTMNYYGDPNYTLTVRKDQSKIEVTKLDKYENLTLLEAKDEELKKKCLKNFLLKDEEDDDYQYVRFEEIGANQYQLDIQHPLTILQGLAIAMSRFEACLKK